MITRKITNEKRLIKLLYFAFGFSAGILCFEIIKGIIAIIMLLIIYLFGG